MLIFIFQVVTAFMNDLLYIYTMPSCLDFRFQLWWGRANWTTDPLYWTNAAEVDTSLLLRISVQCQDTWILK